MYRIAWLVVGLAEVVVAWRQLVVVMAGWWCLRLAKRGVEGPLVAALAVEVAATALLLEVVVEVMAASLQA